MKEYLTITEAAELLGKSKKTLRRWDREGKLCAIREPMSNYRVYPKEQLTIFSDFLKKDIEDYNCSGRRFKAISHNVPPKKRERNILVGIRKDIDLKYEYPRPYNKIYNLADALKKANYTIVMCQYPKGLNI